MKAYCGIDIDKDKTFISFASLSNRGLTPLEEIGITAPFNEPLIQFLRNNIEMFNQRLREKEEELKLHIDRIFLKIPQELMHQRIAEDTVLLKKQKRIDARDISFAKKTLENVVLNWDDTALHHFVLYYETEGVRYKYPPLNLWAKKLTLQSLLVWVKAALYKEVRAIFENVEREFGGFISPALSSLATAFGEDLSDRAAVIDVGYQNSRLTIFNDGVVGYNDGYDFSLRKVIKNIEKQFLFPYPLAEEIFARYISFQHAALHKEVSLKHGATYMNVSTNSLNSFLRDYIKGEIVGLLGHINEKIGNSPCMLSLIGRLSDTEGFHEFIKALLPLNLTMGAQPYGVSSSFGCLKYGLLRFLERGAKHKRDSLVHRLLHLYRDYF